MNYNLMLQFANQLSNSPLESLGYYWLKVYNAGGKGTIEKWMEAQEQIK